LTNEQKRARTDQRRQELKQLLYDLKNGNIDPSNSSEVMRRQVGAYE